MNALGRGDLLVLYLDAVDRGEWADQRARTVAGVTDVLGIGGEGMAGTVELLSVIDDLEGSGLIERVTDESLDRQPYRLTESGQTKAATLREETLDRTITVRNGTTEEIPLSAVDEYLSPPAVPRALSQLTDDDVLYLDTPGERFVNRSTELGILKSSLEAVQDGQSRSVLVAGEPGIGKTTLVQREFGDIAEEAGARVVVAGARAESTVPYGVFRTVLETLPGEENPLATADSDLVDLAPEEYATQQDAMFEDVVTQLVSAAADRPLVVVFEDLPTVDEPTLSLFKHVAGAATPGVLLIGTYRPSEVAEDHELGSILAQWERAESEQLSAVSLEPFTRTETQRLLQWLTGRPDVPSGFVDLVYDRTGGNPLFVEEVTARTIEVGAANPDRGVFPQSASELVLPDTVEAAIDQRIGSLSDSHLAVLEVAALIGQTLPEPVLLDAIAAADLVDTEQSTGALLEHLIDVGVLERTGGGELRFQSEIVRDAVANGLAEDRKSTLHYTIATAYEAVLGGDPDHYAAVAYHRRRAGAREEAVEAYRKAGDRAVAAFAAEIALEAYETAFSIVRSSLDWPDDDQRVLSILEGIADANRLLDDYEAADQYLRYVAERIDDRQRRFTVAKDRAMLWRDRGHLSKALSIIEEELEGAEESDTEAYAELLRVRGTVYSHREEYEAAEQSFQRAHEIAESIGARELSRLTRNHEAFIDMDRGTVDEGTITTWEGIVSEARTLDDRKYLADMLSNLGQARIHYGDIDGARDALLESVDLYDGIGTEMQVCNTRNTLAVALTTAGEWEEAIDLFERSLETAEAVGNEQVAAYTHNNMGSIYQFMGELTASADHLETAMEYSQRIDNPILWGEQSLSLAGIRLYQTRFDEAESIARDVLESVTERSSPALQAHAHGTIGHAHRYRGELDQAIERYRTGVERTENNDGVAPKHGLVPYLGLSRAYLERGEAETALEVATTALEYSAAAMLEEDSIHAKLVLGACYREVGSLGEAREQLDDAEERANAGGWELMNCLASYEQGLLALDSGQQEVATDRLQTARSRAVDIGAQLFVDMATERLSDLPKQ